MTAKVLYQYGDQAVVVKQPDGTLNLNDKETQNILKSFGVPDDIMGPVPGLRFDPNSKKQLQIEEGLIQEVYYKEVKTGEIKNFYYRITLTPSAATKGARGEINIHTADGFEFFIVTGGIAYLTVGKNVSEGQDKHQGKLVTQKTECEKWKLYPGCAVFLRHGIAQGLTGIGDLSIGMSVFTAELLFFMNPIEFKDHGSKTVVMI